MKKWIAMIAALCMMMLMVPAAGEKTAEEEAAGDWHMVLADVEIGVFRLGADGTVSTEIPEMETMEGTWKLEGDVLTITIDGDPLDFAYDGASLVNEEEFMIPLLREEGKLPYETAMKIIEEEDYELPEGMEEEEAKEIAERFSREFDALTEEVIKKNTTIYTAVPEEEAEVEILSENFFVTESYNGYQANYFAKIRNNLTAPLLLIGASMEVWSKGYQLGRTGFPSVIGSEWLAPGEVSFIALRAGMGENPEEISYERKIEVTTTYYWTDRALPLPDIGFVAGGAGYGESYMYAKVTNDTGEDKDRIYVAYALEDEDGTIWDLEYDNIYDDKLCDGSSVILKQNADSNAMKYCIEHGITLTQVEAISWTRE